jgi:hypothetical protein
MRWLRLAILIAFAAVAPRHAALAGGPHETSAGELRAMAKTTEWRDKGEAAIPEMVDALCRDPDNWMSHAASSQLAAHAKKALPRLLGAAANPRCQVSALIAGIVCDTGYGEAELVAMLRDKSPRVLTAALDVLSKMMSPGMFDPRGAPLPPRCAEKITRVVRSLSPVIRTASGEPLRAAVTVAGEAGPSAAPLVPDLVALLGKRDDVTTNTAAVALGKLGAAAAPAVPALRALLPRNVNNVRGNAISALGDIGPPARPALPDFLPILQEAVPQACAARPRWSAGGATAFAIVKAAAKIGGPGVEPLVPHLVVAFVTMRGCGLVDGYMEPWLSAFGAFGKHGTAAMPALLAVVRDDDARLSMRRQALDSLDAIDRSSKHGDVARIREALQRKREVFERSQPGQPEPQLQTPLEIRERAAQRRSPRAFALCREEAGLPPAADPTPPPPRSSALMRDSSFTSCIRDRLCGPGVSDYRKTMAKCCGDSYATEPPWFCLPVPGDG